MEDNIFKFEDFLSGKKEKLKSIKQILENVDEFAEEEESEYSEANFAELDETEEDTFEEEEEEETYESMMTSETDVISEEEEKEEEPYEEEEEVLKPQKKVPEQDKYYNLYSDKSENFVCDIAIQGADPKQTEARLVVESGDWTLMFYGEVKNGKCTIPIKKLNILKENQVGDIRLEVIAEGNIFVPWEDKFKVRVSKKVTVKVNEQKDYYSRPLKKNVGVKVKVKR
jgi:vacuolar-type H+-ATPase subunit I/STV1